MKKYFLFFVLVLIIPSMAYAAWWNPLTWNWNPLSWFSAVNNNSITPKSILSPSSSVEISNLTSPETSSSSASKVNSRKMQEDSSTSPVVRQPSSIKPFVPPPNSTLCNGTYYSVCPTGENFICPSGGGSGYCQSNQPQNIPSNNAVGNQASTFSPVTNTCNGTLCNGTCYNACPSGQDFICPSGGGHAYCQLSQQGQQINLAAQKAQALANLEAALQSWENQLTPLDNNVQELSVQVRQCNANLLPIDFYQGQQGIQAQYAAAVCASLAQEEQGYLQMEVPIQAQISKIQQQIYYVQSQ